MLLVTSSILKTIEAFLLLYIMKSLYVFLIAFSLFNVILGESSTTGTMSSERPMYKPQDIPEGYVPHLTYYDSRTQPGIHNLHPSFGQYYPSTATVVSPIQGHLQTALNLIYKVGFFAIGGVALLFVGSIFLTAICSFTSFCTLSFTSIGNVDKDAMMRSFMTPEKLATAAALVQDAFGKYQRLQKQKDN